MVNGILGPQSLLVSKTRVNQNNDEGQNILQQKNKLQDAKKRRASSVEKIDENGTEQANPITDGFKNKDKIRINNDKSKLKDINEEELEDEEKTKFEDLEQLEEGRDHVVELGSKQKIGGFDLNIPNIKPKGTLSVKSSKSSIFISKLQKQVEEEKKEREKIQFEIQEMKKINNELLNQLKNSKK